MFCPSISYSQLEDTPAANGTCPCDMKECRCTSGSASVHATDIIPRAADLWTPPDNGPKRKSNQRPLNVCVTINRKYTNQALANLFKCGVRCVHLPMAYGTKDELELMALRVNTEVAAHHLRSKDAAEITFAIEIRGRVVRTGRTHNDQPIELVKGNMVFVTSNRDYELCSSKDVVFIYNLDEYLNRIQLNEFIFINNYEIQLVVVKITLTTSTLTCCVLKGSTLASYSRVTLPYLISGEPPLLREELEDCEFACRHMADIIVVPLVSDLSYLQELRKASAKSGAALFSQISECWFEEDLSGVDAIIHASDGLWWSRTPKPDAPFVRYAMEAAHKFFIPNVVAIQPLKKEIPQSLLRDTDCFMMPRFNPYINKALQHKLDQHIKCNSLQQCESLKNAVIDSTEVVTVVMGCTVLTSLLLRAQLILCISNNGISAIRLSQLRPATTILTVVPCKHLARQLNVYRNVRPIVYTEELTADLSYIEVVQEKLTFGLNSAKTMRLAVVGDLIVMCFDVANETDEESISFRTSYLTQDVVEI